MKGAIRLAIIIAALFGGSAAATLRSETRPAAIEGNQPAVIPGAASLPSDRNLASSLIGAPRELHSRPAATAMPDSRIHSRVSQDTIPRPIADRLTVHVPGTTSTPQVWYYAVASSYGIGDGFLGGHLACGGILDNTTLVVAHRTLPCGTRITFRFRGHVVEAVVRDRGPYCCGSPYSRTFDLGPAVARALKFDGLDTVAWHW